MKTVFLILWFFIICSSGPSYAEDFLGAPVIPEGKTVLRTESRLEMVSPLSHDEVMGFYEKALKGYKDIKFRDWKDATHIEDDGKLPWHSITISKHYEEGTHIVIVEDNWTWIIGTLALRYIGVFMVLLFLLVGMYISGAIISRSVKKMEAKKEQATLDK
jgi:hypothetical protein